MHCKSLPGLNSASLRTPLYLVGQDKCLVLVVHKKGAFGGGIEIMFVFTELKKKKKFLLKQIEGCKWEVGPKAKFPFLWKSQVL